MKKNLFTSESVASGHPDKIADQISDAILDAFLASDKKSKVAIETLVTTGLVVISGEVSSTAYVDIQSVARETIKKIGYTKSDYGFDWQSCGIISTVHEQSPDISQGVGKIEDREQGAGDQGMMFGYATDETEGYIPTSLYLSHKIMEAIEDIRKEGVLMTYLRPDGKCQVTVEYEEGINKVKSIDTILISVQHDAFASDEAMQATIKQDIINIVIPYVRQKLHQASLKELLKGNYKLIVNPTGKFVVGGPHGDTGLTGRKIIVDTYGGKGAHGGGAFSGKDPSKVDRSAAYAARFIAKNLVANGIAKEMLIQLSYAIGVPQPISINVNTYGTGKYSDEKIIDFITKTYDLTPYGIEKMLKLRNPIYSNTATLGHFGKEHQEINGVEYYTWEKIENIRI